MGPESCNKRRALRRHLCALPYLRRPYEETLNSQFCRPLPEGENYSCRNDAAPIGYLLLYLAQTASLITTYFDRITPRLAKTASLITTYFNRIIPRFTLINSIGNSNGDPCRASPSSVLVNKLPGLSGRWDLKCETKRRVA